MGAMTCVRLILRLTNQTQVGGGNIVTDFGVAVVTEDGFLAGNVPDPQLYDDYNWYLRDFLYHPSASIGDAGVITRQFDIRTARKLRGADHTLALIVYNGGNQAINWAADWRLLLVR